MADSHSRTSRVSRRSLLQAGLAAAAAAPVVAASPAEAASALIGPVAAPGFAVMTFNVRYSSDASWFSPDWWPGRAEVLRDILATERPTILGAQEAMANQVEAISKALPGHKHFGRGRDDGAAAGEHCPIWWDAERFEAVETEQFWLSDTPQVPGSTGWGNVVPRIVVRVTLRDKAADREVVVVNTHLDNASEEARRRTVEVLAKLTERFEGKPLILVGDFNAPAEDCPEYRTLTGTVGFEDAWLKAERRLTPAYGTFPNYQPPFDGAARIDWILTRGLPAPDRAAINPTKGPIRWASDHLPMQAAWPRLP